MTTVRLVDGAEVDSASEAWRHECEARHILALPTLPERRAWLEAIEKRRGTDAVKALRRTMLALHEAGQPAGGGSRVR
jgi:hypothetical protein